MARSRAVSSTMWPVSRSGSTAARPGQARSPRLVCSVAEKPGRVSGFRLALRAVHGPEKVGEVVRVNLGHVRHGGSGGPFRLTPFIEGGVLDSRAAVEAAGIDALAGHCGVQ